MTILFSINPYMPTRSKVHRPAQQRTRQQFDHARSAKHSKTYDYTWRVLSKAFRQMNPLCAECLRSDIIKLATEVHHIIDIADAPDRRLDTSNLESLCHECHSTKTAMRTINIR